MEDRPPFKTLLGHALVKDETGEMVPKVIRDFLNSQRLARGEKKLDYRKVGKKKGKVTF